MKPVYGILLFTLLFFGLPAMGQTRLKSIMNSISATGRQLPVEKLYLHTDKANYVQDDTLWFKAYLLDADYLKPSPRSGLLYVELDDNDNVCVKRVLVPVVNGLTWGNITLVREDISEGNYTLRAYTNWMRNFGEDYVFSKNIYVASAGDRSQLVTAAFKGQKNNIQAAILLTNADRQPLRLQDLQLRVLNGSRTLMRKNLETGIDGRLDVNFTIPDNIQTKNLAIAATETKKGEQPVKLTIPVVLNRPENTDLQFMPEGGAMVDGIPAKIGFKAIGEDGKSVEVSGKIYNNKQQEVASFNSTHKGIGVFELTPHAGEIYTAVLMLPGGATKSYPLPVVNATGTSLHITKSGDDSIRVSIASKTAVHADYYLIGQSRGVVCYGERVIIKNGAALTGIPESAFPTGIARFTLLSPANQPLNERIIYIDHHDDLKVSIIPGNQKYSLRDSIAVQLQVTDKDGTPVAGDFSMAVTDDNQVKPDSLGGNIVNDMLFTNDLKGNVEDPAYYFSDNTSAQKESELDNLLLTQGWVGYTWQQVFGPAEQPLYPAQKQFEITGTVTNAFNKPVTGSRITLLSNKPAVARDTLTGKDGRFIFSGLFPVDTASFFIQSRRKGGSSFNIRLDVDEFKPPVFKLQARRVVPWYVNTAGQLLQNRANKISQQLTEQELSGHGKMLKEVTIRNKRIIKDSKNLNGSGEADYVLDEKDMAKAPRMTLFEVLQKSFGSLDVLPLPRGNHLYRLKNHIVKFYIDGLEIDRLSFGIQPYMDYLTSDDIKGIEVMYTGKYATAYDPQFVVKLITWPDEDIPVYIEITTRSGHGAFYMKQEVKYRYKPMPFSLPKEFYRPRYAVKKMPDGTDQRSAIHWAPNIVTDTAGKATASFYNADKPACYTIIVQGTDLNGHLGVARKRISIN